MKAYVDRTWRQFLDGGPQFLIKRSGGILLGLHLSGRITAKGILKLVRRAMSRPNQLDALTRKPRRRNRLATHNRHPLRPRIRLCSGGNPCGLMEM